MSGAAVALVGALDTKGAEYDFVRDRLLKAGVGSVVVDVGVLGAPLIPCDVAADRVAEAGGTSIEELRSERDRGTAVAAMAKGAAAVVARLHGSGRVAGALVLGGSNAGVVMSRIAAALPLGVPKLLVSTIVAGDTRPYVGTADLMMMNPVVDIAGLNSISTVVLAHAADAMAGMVLAPPPPARSTARSVACTMFGVTTACVGAVEHALSTHGDEVQVFHANGTGGRTLEALIRDGRFAAVADITTTELADELLGGVCSAGPRRLEAAAECGVPQVVSVGALDMVNFGPLDSVPARFRQRRLLAHNPAVTLMRTDPVENDALGAAIARKLNSATAPCEVHVPVRGFSQVSVEGGPFHDPESDAALIAALERHMDPRIPLHLHDTDINDPRFAAAVLEALGRVAPLMEGITT